MGSGEDSTSSGSGNRLGNVPPKDTASSSILSPERKHPTGSFLNQVIVFVVLSLTVLTLAFVTNAAIIIYSVSHPPEPLIHSIVVSDTGDGPMLISANIEFPVRSVGNLLHVQINGDISVDLHLLPDLRAAESEKDRIVRVIVPGNREILLRTWESSSLQLSDIQLHFNPAFEGRMLTGFIQPTPETPQPKALKINVNADVVLLSFWFPFEIKVHRDFVFSLDELIVNRSEPAEMDYSSLVPRDIVFDSAPKSLHLSLKQPIPKSLVPPFLHVDLPALSFEVGQYLVQKRRTPSDAALAHNPRPMIRLRTGALSIHGGEEDHFWPVSLEMDEAGGEAALELAQAFSNNGLDDFAIHFGLEKVRNGTAVASAAGSLMNLLQAIDVDLPLASQTGNASNVTVKKKSSPKPASPSAPSSIQGMSELVAVTFDGITNATSSADHMAFRARLTLRREAIEKFVKLPNDLFANSLPILGFRAAQAPSKKPLFDFSIIPELKVEPGQDLSISFEWKLYDFNRAIMTMLSVAGLGSEQLKRMPGYKEAAEISLGPIDRSHFIHNLASKLELLVRNNQDAPEIVFASTKLPVFREPKPGVTPLPEDSQDGNGLFDLASTKRHYKMNFALDEAEAGMAAQFSFLVNQPEQAYNGTIATISWKDFKISLQHENSSLVEFVVNSGELILGTDNFTPLRGGLGMAIAVPDAKSREDYFDGLDSLMMRLSQSQRLVPIDLVLATGWDTKKVQLLLPSAPLLKAPPSLASAIPVGKSAAAAGSASEPVSEPKDSPTFLSSIVSPIAHFVGFKESFFHLHVKYPQQNFCSIVAQSPMARMVLDANILIPALAVNACGYYDKGAREGSEQWPKADFCFAKAGLTESLLLRVQIINGQICQMKSILLTDQTRKLLLEHTEKPFVKLEDPEPTGFRFDEDEIPVQAGFLDYVGLVNFVDAMVKARPFTMSLGRNKDQDSFLNAWINSVGRLALQIPMNYPVAARRVVLAESSATDAKALAAPGMSSDITVIKGSNLQVKAYLKSYDETSAEIGIQAKMPKECFEGIRHATWDQNRFQWPVVRWGKMKFSLGVKDVGSFDAIIEGGQIELKPEGIFTDAMQNFGMRLKLSVNQGSEVGTTVIRQVLGTFLAYASKTELGAHNLDSFFRATAYYRFVAQDVKKPGDQFNSQGEVTIHHLMSLFELAQDTVAANAEYLPALEPLESSASKAAPAPSAAPPQLGLFSKASVLIKTIPHGNKRDPQVIDIPCIVPALCSADDMSRSRSMTKPLTIAMIVSDALQPMADEMARYVAMGLKSILLTKFPQNFEIDIAMGSPISLGATVNGAGVAVVALPAFRIHRVAEIPYNVEQHPKLAEEKMKQDVFFAALEFYLPDTFKELCSSLSSIVFQTFPKTVHPPMLFEKVDDKTEPISVTLVNQPFAVALAVENHMRRALKSNEQNFAMNLLSKVIAGLAAEMVIPGLDLHSATVDTEKPKSKPAKKVSTENASIAKYEADPKLRVTEQVFEMPSVMKLVSAFNSIARWIVLGFNDPKAPVSFQVKTAIPWPEGLEMLKLALPKTITASLVFEAAKIVKISISGFDSQATALNLDEGGIKLKVQVDVCMRGLEEKNVLSDESIGRLRKYLYDEVVHGALPLSMVLDFDSQMLVKTRLSIPISTMLKNVFPGWIQSTILSVKTVPEDTNIKEIAPPAYEALKLDEDLVGPINEGNECWHFSSMDEYDPTPDTRLRQLDLKKTRLFYRRELGGVKPRIWTVLYLQLRTAVDKPLCSLPNVARQLDLILTPRPTPFVQLYSLFSSTEDHPEGGHVFSAEYLPQFAVFRVRIRLPWTGTYDVSIRAIDGTKERIATLPFTQVYVQQEW